MWYKSDKYRVMLNLRFTLTLHHIATAPYMSLAVSDQVYGQWVISHVLEGHVQTETRGVRSVATAGDVMIHPPNLPFSEHAETPGIHQWMAVDARTGDIPPRDFLAAYPLPLCLSLNIHKVAYISDFEALQVCCGTPDDPFSQVRAVALGASLLQRLVTVWQEGGAIPRSDTLHVPQARFAELVAYMAANLHKAIGRDELARAACLHPGSLDRAFRASHGVAPVQMLRSMRLERARRLLESTPDTLESIAIQVGLGDAARFSRAFRMQYGIAPGAYRHGSRAAKSGYITEMSSPVED